MTLLIIGAGPAGMKAALWAARLGLEVELVEGGARPGGQLLGEASTGDWALGHAGITPRELAALYARELGSLPPVRLRIGVSVTGLALDAEPGLRARYGDGSSQLHRAVIIASGLRPRDLPDERLVGPRTRVVVGAADARLRGGLDGARVGILGAGDNAYEVALLLAARGCTVEIMQRGAPRAAPRFITACAATPGIRTRRIAPDYRVVADPDGVTLESAGETLRHDWLVALLGYLPNTGFLRSSGIPFSDAALTADGFVVTDDAGRTPVARLYAAGDCTGKPYSGLPMALGQGAIAAKSCALDLALLP
jgi:thioredoxin reductase